MKIEKAIIMVLVKTNNLFCHITSLYTDQLDLLFLFQCVTSASWRVLCPLFVWVWVSWHIPLSCFRFLNVVGSAFFERCSPLLILPSMFDDNDIFIFTTLYYMYQPFHHHCSGHKRNPLREERHQYSLVVLMFQ